MAAYAYSARPTRNPLRYALALWRMLRSDLDHFDSRESAIVVIGFIRSRFARWEGTVAHLREHPQTRDALRARQSFGPVGLEDLATRPEGSLGRVFADHCRARGIDPNIIHVPPADEVDWVINHFFESHDLWHVVTGWGNDVTGEAGLLAFYCGQLRSAAYFPYILSIILLNAILRRGDLDGLLAASAAGYRAGRSAEPIFGVEWDALWNVPLEQVCARFAIDRSEITGEGIPAAA